MRRASLAVVLLLAGCGAADDEAPDNAEPTTPPALPGPGSAPQAANFPALASAECVAVVQFYFEAIGGREWDQAALVWDDPVIDGARLAAVFAGYRLPQIEWTEPFEQDAPGGRFCTVSGKLTDAEDPAKVLRQGTLLLRRGASAAAGQPDQSRWTLQSSTFVESLERARR
jgi:hypothetical protein